MTKIDKWIIFGISDFLKKVSLLTIMIQSQHGTMQFTEENHEEFLSTNKLILHF